VLFFYDALRIGRRDQGVVFLTLSCTDFVFKNYLDNENVFFQHCAKSQ
jgi:hypothetical protein